ncbi:MAG: glycoside hydrolase family 5 protein [Treponema sp.]|jgi:endoglucanase|nr:glycoside hydrolase family 5 protein [Treponema sp.]
MRKIKPDAAILALFFIFGLWLVTCKSAQESGQDIPSPFNDISAEELAANIKIGWNLGNTLDTSDLYWLEKNAPVSQFETAWGNPVTTKANIDAVRNAGFNAIRIPVSWSKAANRNYVIRDAWMNRVKHVVNYAVSNDMYIILNTHHDEDIFKFRDSEMAESRKAFQAIWKQIADNFRNYDEKLIFEGLNEPRTKGSPGEWNGGTGEERNNLNILNQLFVDTVRASGGNNLMRVLMVPTYAASALAVAMNALTIPSDPQNSVNKIIVSIHAYEPYNFALNEKSTVNTWSVSRTSDTAPITERIDRAYNLFVGKGIPVIMGEFGALNKGNEEARAQWAEFYTSYAKSRGIKCFWWDNGGQNDPPLSFCLLIRRTNRFAFPLIVGALMRGAE